MGGAGSTADVVGTGWGSGVSGNSAQAATVIIIDIPKQLAANVMFRMFPLLVNISFGSYC